MKIFLSGLLVLLAVVGGLGCSSDVGCTNADGCDDSVTGALRGREFLVDQLEGRRGPFMPPRMAEQLTREQIDAIVEWVRTGWLDN
jgi:hypothetical protein